jgi:hypothetical protein
VILFLIKSSSSWTILGLGGETATDEDEQSWRNGVASSPASRVDATCIYFVVDAVCAVLDADRYEGLEEERQQVMRMIVMGFKRYRVILFLINQD